MNPSKIVRIARAKRDPAMALVMEMDRIEAGLEAKLTDRVLHNMKGKDGTTPIKGKDYFTHDEINQIIAYVQRNIRVPRDGEDGKDADESEIAQKVLDKVHIPTPKDGYTPTAGVDYPTEEQVKALISTEIAYLFSIKPKGEKGVTKAEVDQLIGTIQQKVDWKENPPDIARALETIKVEKDKLDYYALKNRPDLSRGERGMARGGGGHTIQDEGTNLTSRGKLNFVGAGVSVTDDAANGATKVTISAGGGDGVPTFATFGATGDGVTDDFTALQDALEWSVTNGVRVRGLPGTYLISAPLEIPASASFLFLDLEPDCRIQRTFSSTGISGMLINADAAGAAGNTTRPKNITIKGGNWGSAYTADTDGTATAVTYSGNIFCFIADNLTLDGVHMNGLDTSGRFFLGGGENFTILKPVWKHATVNAGTGGCRILAGSGVIADGEIISGDDTLAVVQGESGDFADLDIGHVVFRDMRGRSTAARFLAVGMTDQTAGSQASYTASTERVDFVRCTGSGALYTAIVTAVDTTGQIGEVNIIDCDLTDASPTDASLFYAILVDGGTGLSRGGAMGVGAVRVVRTKINNTHGTAFQQLGEVGTIVLDELSNDQPREAGSSGVIVRQAQHLIVRHCDITPYDGENGYQIGTSTATETVARMEVHGGIVRSVLHSGASTVRYGFNLVRVGSAIFTGRPRVEVDSASIYVRFLGINANCSNIHIESADMREILAATPIQDNASGTRYGFDILTGTDTYRVRPALVVETPTGTVNGVNVTFTVTGTPQFIVTETGIYVENFGYTLSGTTVTMTIAPSSFIRAYR